MAAPLITSLVTKVGKTMYRQGNRIVSKNSFVRQTRNTARRVKYAADKISRGGRSIAEVARQLMNDIGPPIGGGDWVSRVRGSGERFAEMASDEGELA